MNKIVKLLLLSSFLISSCGIFRDKNLAKRYRNLNNVSTFRNANDPQSFVQVDAKSVIVKEATEKEIKFNVLSLSDKGQQAFIESANLKSTDAKGLMELLNSNFVFTKEEKSNIRVVPKTLKKSIVFTIDRLQYQYVNPTKTIFNLMGDRISYLELDLKLSNSSAAIFNSWDRFVTDKLTLNLGKVSSAQNWNASLNLSAKAGAEASLVGANSTEGFQSDKNSGTTTLVNNGASGTNTNGNFELLSTGKGTDSKTNSAKGTAELGGSASIGFTDKYETSLDLTSQILKLSGTLGENKIILRQEGGPSIDLSGNVSVLVEYAITDDWAAPVIYTKYKELYSGSTLNNLSAIKQSLFMVIFPDVKKDVTGELNYSFLYRQVNKGNRHLPEARQKVTYWYGNVPFDKNEVTQKKVITLVNKNDIRPKSYQITKSGIPLYYKTTEINFETISEASTFLSYIYDLIQNGSTLTELTTGGTPITSGDFSSLRIITKQL